MSSPAAGVALGFAAGALAFVVVYRVAARPRIVAEAHARARREIAAMGVDIPGLGRVSLGDNLPTVVDALAGVVRDAMHVGLP